VGGLCPTSTWECFWKTGAFPGISGCSRRQWWGVGPDVFPTTVIVESFEETDTVRQRWFEIRHGRQGVMLRPGYL
jgi:hypothetical protein